jgi:hypothetical protein
MKIPILALQSLSSSGYSSTIFDSELTLVNDIAKNGTISNEVCN